MARLITEKAALPMAPEALVSALLRTIASWTEELPGSRSDTTPLEADPGRAEDKRTIAWDRFTDAALDALVLPKATPPPLASAPAYAPPPLPRYHLAINNQDTGPLDQQALESYARRGDLHDRTLVWTPSMPGWAAASEVPALAQLLSSLRPPPLRPAHSDLPPPIPAKDDLF